MTSGRPTRILKVLTPNDVGETGSHQAGWTVPRAIIGFFPPLDARVYNPDTWIVVKGPGNQSWSWRYIYYNNRLHHAGTRNEYRLTHVVRAMRDLGARADDLVEFTRDSNGHIRVRLVTERAELVAEGTDVIELSATARWYVADVPAR